MAISFVQRTIGGVAKDALVVTGTAETEQVILKEGLMTVDLEFLALVDLSAGADLAAKLAATTLPNGRNAADIFASRIALTVDLDTKATRVKLGDDVVAAIEALDARVAALEVAP